MRGRSYQGCRTFGGSGCASSICRPGCTLPCCAPSRRCSSLSPRKNRCTWLPAPARTTRRYCGDPCSPPPPACTPRPCRPSTSCQYRPRCDPCPAPRPRCRTRRPRTSPRCGSNRTFKSYSPITSCLPQKFRAPDPCTPRRRPGRCDPCDLDISELCCPSRPCKKPAPCASTCSYKGSKSKGGSCRGYSGKGRNKCAPSRSGSSYCGSYCSSPRITKSRCSKGRSASPDCCDMCNSDPCACFSKDNCMVQQNVTCKDSASNGPTKWFLKKSEKLSKCQNSREHHFCPWEADVTVSGTVRAHCTSTAVEVAKRLTGKFVSRGKRYTSKGDKCDNRPAKNQCQKMTLGYLDDGTKLDFSRNKSPAGDCGDAEKCYNGNATSAASTRSRRAISSGADYRDYITNSVRERKLPGGGTYVTASIGRDARSSRRSREEGYYNARHHEQNSSRNREEEHCDSRCYEKHGNHIRQSKSTHRRHKNHSHNRSSRPCAVSSDTDNSNSVYRTASESSPDEDGTLAFSRRPLSNGGVRHQGRGVEGSEFKGVKRSEVRGYRSQEDTSRRQQTWRPQVSPCTSSEQEDARDDSAGESEVIQFNHESGGESGSDNRADNYHDDDNDDSDDAYHQPSRSMAERCAREVERYQGSPVSYSTTSRAGRTSGRDQGSWGSDEGEVRERRSSHKFNGTIDLLDMESPRDPKSKYLSRRKRVTYEKGL